MAYENTSLSKLMAAPKGVTVYRAGDAFMLHVFWEAPSMAAALELLEGLRVCATATHRDTPCVPTYLFRVSNNNRDLCAAPPATVQDHPKLLDALKKLRVGIPRATVVSNLVKQGFDASAIDLDPDAALPAALQVQPVAVEFTEVYLDEQAFMEHAGSREYLDGYAVVMNPALFFSVPSSYRAGTPPDNIVEKILDPVLRAEDIPLSEHCFVWRQPTAGSSSSGPAFLSLEVAGTDAGSVSASLDEFRARCCTLVVFAHPMREAVVRIMCVLPASPTLALAPLSALTLLRGEAHVSPSSDEKCAALQQALAEAGLGVVTVNASPCVGYALHAMASDVRPGPQV